IPGSFCKTPKGESAKCVDIRKCNSLLILLRQPSKTPEQLNFLRQSQCGFASGSVLVCCGSSLTETITPYDNGDGTYEPNSLIPSRDKCGIQVMSGFISSVHEYLF
ncbi:hypothetical protein GWI33_012702, partial [Rhynchophorus ferrugineus]